MLYLDYHATTPVDPQVLQAMLPYFSVAFGNPASKSHRYGWEAEAAVEKARSQVADLLSASPAEIVFTSGATEANNLALRGVLEGLQTPEPHVITQATEHPSVLEPLRHWIEINGGSLTVLPVDGHGTVRLEQLDEALCDRTVLVSIMHANNEIGTLLPLAEISRLTRPRGIILHADAAQSVGKVPVNVNELGVDLLSLSSHKFYGPKGIGALYLRRGGMRSLVVPQLRGGGQESGLRSGTVAVPNVVGLGAAAKVAQESLLEEMSRIGALRDYLWQLISKELPDARINGHPDNRLPGNLNIRFSGLTSRASELLVALCRTMAVSSGSACGSSDHEPTHVLSAIGCTAAEAQSSIRFGLGRPTTREEIEQAAAQVVNQVKRLAAT